MGEAKRLREFVHGINKFSDRIELIIAEALTDVDPRVQGRVFADLVARWIVSCSAKEGPEATRAVHDEILTYLIETGSWIIEDRDGQELPGPWLQLTEFDVMPSQWDGEVWRLSAEIWPTIAEASLDFDARVHMGVFFAYLTQWIVCCLVIEGSLEATRVLRKKVLADAVRVVRELVEVHDSRGRVLQ